MLFELIIVLEVIAFLFLALGLIPYGTDKLSGKVPLMNKVIFVSTAAIIFFLLGMTTVVYDYNYCYVNESISSFVTNSTISTATCASYQINDYGLSYFNMFLGFVCLVIMVILVLFALASRHEGDPGMGDYDA